MTEAIQIDARPESVSLDPRRSAVVVVDVQNGFASKGGYFDRAGFDISEAPATVAKCRRVIDAARDRGMRIIYLQMGWHADLHDAGRPHGGIWHKSVALRFMRKYPDRHGSPIVRGTWDFSIVDELAPRAEDIVITKTRLSGFFETNLDSVLRGLGVEWLAFVGIATNICVEATIYDALYRDYLCLLIEDATSATPGPDYVKKGALFNVEHILGWVTTTDTFCSALSSSNVRREK